MSKRLFTLLGLLLLLFSLAACTNRNDNDHTNKEEVEKAENIEETNKEVEPLTTIVTDAFGEVEMPTNPERMLVTSPRYAEVLIELGIIPHMVLFTNGIEPEYRLQLLEEHGVEIIELAQFEQNFEKLVSLNPDFIITSGIAMETSIYEKYTKIAPTYAAHSGYEMKDFIDEFATLFHKEVEAEAMLATYNQKINTTKETLRQQIEGKTILVLRVEPKDYRYLGYDSGGLSDLLYRQLGFDMPENLKAGERWFNSFSIEILPESNPDFILLERRAIEDENSDEYYNDLLTNILWKNLDAVQNNRVFSVETKEIIESQGPIGYNLLMDHLIELISNEQE